MVVGGERSEPPLALDTTKDKWYKKGSGLTDACPRAGSILLESWKRERIIVNTTCNSWRCVSCRERNKNRFKTMVMCGISNLGRSSFITVTYKEGAERLQVAGCVARDWKALFRRLKREDPWLASLPKLRVMELTKKGTPHFHLVIGNIPESRKIRCFGRSFNLEQYRRRFDDCACVAHVIARAWKRVQAGESWIVHATPVGSARGAAAYLCKYLQKEFDGERAVRLGMKCRWSASRNWPSEPRSRLKISTSLKGWRRSSWSPHGVDLSGMEFTPEVKERRETEEQRVRRVKGKQAALMRLVDSRRKE